MTADQIRAAAADPSKEQMQHMLEAQQQLIAQLQAANAPPPVAEKQLKLYFNSVPFCNIHVMRSPGYCEQLQFIGGRLETEDPQVQTHLDAVCDKQGSTITSVPAGGTPEDVVRMKADIRAAAEVAHGKMLAAGLSTA